MGGKSPKPPPPRDYYKESTDALKAQVQYAPALFASEAAFRPMYQQLELGGYRTSLLGRVNAEDLSAASRAEYEGALRKQQEAKAFLAEYDAGRQAAATRALTMKRGGTPPTSKELEAKVQEARILAMTTPTPAAFSDKGLLQILEQDVMPAMSRAEAASMAAQREADIAAVEQFGRRASQAYLDADPRTKGLLEELNKQAMADLQTGGRLSEEQQRSVEQQARAAMAQRGLGLGRQAVASELFATQKAIDARNALNRANAGTVLGLNKAFTADPFMAILGRQGQAFSAGMNQQSFASNFQSSIGPRLFNPESQAAMDINASNQQAIMATNAAKAQITSGIYQGIGSAVGGMAGGVGQAGGVSEYFG